MSGRSRAAGNERYRSGLSLLFLGVAALLSACSFHTEYVLRANLLSFTEEDERHTSFTVSTLEAVDIYLYPRVQAVPADSLPDLEFQGAYPVEFPDYDGDAFSDAPQEVGLTLTLTSHTVLENFSGDSPLPDGEVQVFAAGLDTENVYRDQFKVANTELPLIGQGASETVVFEASPPLDPAYAEAGGVRVGIRVRIQAAESDEIDGSLTQTKLDVELSGYPLRALP